MEAAVELLDASCPDAWLAALDGVPHAFGHRPEFVAAAAEVSAADAVLWTWRRGAARAICPLLARSTGTDGGIELATPPGFAGLTAMGDCATLAADWTSWWRDAGAVCAYVQAAPSLGGELVRGAELQGPGELLASWPGPDASLARGADCLVWDLRPDPGRLLAAMQSKHRQLLRKWQRGSPEIVEDQALLRAAFPALYAGFIARREVSPAYRFTESGLRRVLAAPGTLLVGARGAEGDLEAVTLFIASGRRGDSFLSAATQAGRRHSRGLYWQGAMQLRERGIVELNLGGGIGDNDDLAAFKRRLGAAPTPTWTVRQVFDRVRFAAACDSAGVDPDGAWFPPWRARP